MTSAATSYHARRAAEPRRLDRRAPLIAVLLFFPLALALSWPQILSVWQTGGFEDTDDALRAVQIRDWLGGQAWFDLVPHRIDPAHAFVMHWSRILDVPIGLMIRLSGLLIDPDHAERLARIVFPLGLQAGLIAATVSLAARLAGSRAALAAAMLVVASGMSYGQFEPGDIDHHGAQILLLVLMAGAMVRAFDPAQCRPAALLGGLCVLSLAISLENLPFIAVLVAVPALCWVADGRTFRKIILFEALGIAIAVPLFYVVTVAPWNYATAACDTYSLAHAVGFLAGAAALGMLGVATSRLDTRRSRGLALGAAGAGVLRLMHVAFPACLHDPYSGLDPLIRDLWLSHVTEAQPLWVAATLRPGILTLLICPVMAGAAAILVALWCERGRARARWVAVAGLVLIGCAGALWEFRVAAFLQPLALLGGAWAVARAAEFAIRRNDIRWFVAPLALILMFSPLAWVFVPAPGMSAETEAQLAGGALCRKAGSVNALAGLPAGLAFAPIELGAHLIAQTKLTVLAAPYHRNQSGNRLVLEGFLAPSDQARPIVEASGARFVIVCSGELQMDVLAKAAPDGLAAALAAGRVPDWLVPVPVPDTPYKVFDVR